MARTLDVNQSPDSRKMAYMLLLCIINPAGRERLKSDQNVMFWLVSEIATAVRRAEGNPSTLSAHGGSSCDV